MFIERSLEPFYAPLSSTAKLPSWTVESNKKSKSYLSGNIFKPSSFATEKILARIFSFIDIHSLQPIRKTSRDIRRIIDSPLLWNEQTDNLKKQLQSYSFSFTTTNIGRSKGEYINRLEKRALHVYLTVFRNIQTFYKAFTHERRAYLFTLSKSGEVTFVESANTRKDTYLLLTKIDPRINTARKIIGEYYSNCYSAQTIYSFAIAKMPTSKSAKAGTCFFDETTSEFHHRIMFLFTQVLNNIASHNQSTYEEALSQGFHNERSCVTFEDITSEEMKLIQYPAKSRPRDPLSSIPSKLKIRDLVTKSMMAHLYNVICPQEIMSQLPLPCFKTRFRENELVVVKRPDNTHRYGFIERRVPRNNEEKEATFIIAVNEGDDFIEREAYRSSMIYRLPDRILNLLYTTTMPNTPVHYVNLATSSREF